MTKESHEIARALIQTQHDSVCKLLILWIMCAVKSDIKVGDCHYYYALSRQVRASQFGVRIARGLYIDDFDKRFVNND